MKIKHRRKVGIRFRITYDDNQNQEVEKITKFEDQLRNHKITEIKTHENDPNPIITFHIKEFFIKNQLGYEIFVDLLRNDDEFLDWDYF